LRARFPGGKYLRKVHIALYPKALFCGILKGEWIRAGAYKKTGKKIRLAIVCALPCGLEKQPQGGEKKKFLSLICSRVSGGLFFLREW
jgi:hypothetical protein